MGSSLQRIRGFLWFGQPSAEEQHVAAVRELLGGIVGRSPEDTVDLLAGTILPAIGRQSDVRVRYQLLEDARHEAEQALPMLERIVAHAVLPLPPDAAKAALQADNLLKGLSVAYTSIAHGLRGMQRSGGLSLLYHRSIQRAMAMVARRQLLAYRAYASPSTTSWQTLHELYRMVRSPQSSPLNGETAPIEHEYLGALLFAFLDPSKLPRTELESINLCSRQLAAYAVVGDITTTSTAGPTTESCFLVRPDEGGPGYPLLRLPAGKSIFGSILIDCTQVLAALDRNLTRRPGKTVEPDLDAPPALLQILRVAISGKSTRRFNRTTFRPRADLVVGLAAVTGFLDGHVFSRRAIDADGHRPGRNFASSEWALMDESPEGFRLRFLRGDKSTLVAGDLVALQPRESSKIHLCLLRRITSSKVRLEIGLQVLSPQACVADIICQGLPVRRGVFLQNLPAYGKFSGLVAPFGNYHRGQQVMISLPGRSLHRQIGTCLETSEAIEFFALDQLPG